MIRVRMAFAALPSVLMLASCGSTTVHQDDLQSWKGVPVDQLDKHPMFRTMQVVRTRATDGTEIRDYVDGDVASCSAGGTVFAGSVDLDTYSEFSNCMKSFPACQNIFYVKDGVVLQYAPIGTGGMGCNTNKQTRPVG